MFQLIVFNFNVYCNQEPDFQAVKTVEKLPKNAFENDLLPKKKNASKNAIKKCQIKML